MSRHSPPPGGKKKPTISICSPQLSGNDIRFTSYHFTFISLSIIKIAYNNTLVPASTRAGAHQVGASAGVDMGAGDGWLSLGLSRAQGQGFTVATRKGRTDGGRRTIKILKCAGEEPPLPMMPAILPPVGLVLGTCHLSLPTENE